MNNNAQYATVRHSTHKAEVGVGDFIELKVTDCVQTKKKLKLVISLKLSLKMDLSDYEVPRVLVTCRRRQIYDENDDENVPLYYHINKDFSIPFGREEFCLVTGLRFGVQNWAEYDTKQRIPFRRRVFPSYLDGQPITGIDIANMINDESFAQLYDDDVVGLCCLGILQLVILGVESTRVVPDWMLRLANDRVAWDKYPWGSYVWPTLYSQLRNAIVKRWSPLYVDEPTDEDDAKKYSIFGYTWAFKTWILESYRVTAIRYFDRYNRYPRVAAWNKKKGRFLGPMVIPFFEGNMPAARLTPDDNEARSDWWISSRAYFDGFICQVERVPFDLSRQNMYEIPSDIYRDFDEQKREIERNKKEVDNIKKEMRKFREEMNVQCNIPYFQGHVNSYIFQNYGVATNFLNPNVVPNRVHLLGKDRCRRSDTQYWQPDTSSQPGSYYSFGRVPFHMGRQNLQTTIETHDDVDGIFYQNIPNRGRRTVS
ncbi:phospholipase-like protein [Tanacetum coccineum]